MKPNKTRLIISIVLYTLFVTAYAVWYNVREERVLLRHIDERLFAAAASLKYMLKDDFHDRAVSADSIEWEEIEQNRLAISGFAFETPFEYLYTLVEKDGNYYFSAPTVTPEEYLEKKSWYFHPYEDVPEGFKTAFEENRTVYVTYGDQWGTFRSIALPQTSPGGKLYLSCADYNISYISNLIVRNYTVSVLTALFFMLLTIPFLFLYRGILVSHNKALRVVNYELEEYQDHLEDLVLRRTAELETEKSKAEEANRLKSRLLFNVSHELRTPLNGIVGYCEALRDTEDLELVYKYGEIIQREADILLALINDLLDLARIESGKMSLAPAPFQFRRLVDDTVKGQAILAKKKGLGFTVSIDPSVPEFLLGDSLRIRQVLLNLVSNAVKFTEKGSVAIRVESREQEGDRVLIVCSVRDTGIGIPKDKIPVIFGSFSQADPSVTRRFGGTGLGVSIAHQLVELMGGKIDVESEPDKGSVFRFSIPLEICSLSPNEAEVLTRDHQEEDGRNLAGQGTILLVDDYKTNLDILTLFFEKAGYAVEKADSGEAAVELCETTAFDCIFLDIQMPGIDGFETVRRIRKPGSLNAATTVIGLSASVDESTREKCETSGMNGFLLKPVKKNRLLSLTAYWIGKGGPPVAREAPATVSANGVLDTEAALIGFEGDKELYITALEAFIPVLKDPDSPLNRDFGLSDPEDLFRDAHKTKGAAALLGAGEIRYLTGKIEERARAEDMSGTESLLRDFKEASRRCIEAMEEYIRREAE